MRVSTCVGWGITALSALALLGCGPVTVSSYAERGVDFTHYRTYEWTRMEERPTGNPRLDNNPFFAERLQHEIERQLSGRGYVKAIDGAPDLAVRTYVKFIDVVNADNIDRQATSKQGEGPEPHVLEAGTLWIDVLDGRTDTLIWRGWAEGSVDGVIDNQTWMDQKITDVVTRIMDKFPRRP